MTREEIKTVVELFISWNGETAPIDTSNLDSAVDYINECMKPQISSNLDEVAEQYALDVRAKPFGNLVKEAFKAGAEWMAGQGIKLHGRILPGPKCNLYIESDCFDRGYKGLNYSFSDSNDVDMFVQIRKK